MMLLRPRSLQLRLAVRLGALLLITTVLAVVTLGYVSSRTAESLSRRDQFRLSDGLSGYVNRDMSVSPLPEWISRALREEGIVYAIRTMEGEVIAASDDAIRREAASRPMPGGRVDFLLLEEFGDPPRTYQGLTVRERSDAGPVAVLLAEPRDAEDELLHALLREIAMEAIWVIPLFIGATLLVGVFAIRSGLRPLRDTAEQASAIRPESMSVRLSPEGLPSEVLPLVEAVNRALSRLEEGFALQREFTANAAHELRTPLAIITGAVEELANSEASAKIRSDVARMNRLVEQLLHVARLDSVVMEKHAAVDLNDVARSIVERMAPLAIGQDRALALIASDTGVIRRGNRAAIEDALRNLVENAIAHTPPGSEVTIQVTPGGSIRVCDHGPGVPDEHREAVLNRFWRGPAAGGTGSGLGLAIVKEIMQRHGGTVEVSDNEGGGACFVLQFPESPPPVNT